MAILVDPLRVWAHARGPFRAGACHLVTDGPLDELHAFAGRLGLRREWFQARRGTPHYDLSPGGRSLAVSLGAVEVSTRELLRALKRHAG